MGSKKIGIEKICSTPISQYFIACFNQVLLDVLLAHPIMQNQEPL